jgi:RNA polymerase sigma factor (sigma-70 family)
VIDMTTRTLTPVINQLRRIALLQDGVGLPDGQLLESFVRDKDEFAFEALVRRHGPMVLGVCRRLLRNHHDAEDAFQATFIVLVRKASSIIPREMIANWLYGTAYRTALKARSIATRRRMRERQVSEMPEPQAVGTDHRWHDLQPLLDQELSRLPDKYRVPLVLCDLEGKTGKEVARQLGWPDGTVASRLSRGRAMLAKRLTRHGVALSGCSLAMLVSQNSACASVSTSLVFSTVKAASLLAAGRALTSGLVSAKVAALTEGVLKAMLLNKLKIPIALLAIGVVGTGLGGVSFRAAATDDPVTQSDRRVAQEEVNRSPVVQPLKGKRPEDQSKASDPREAFLKGFQISTELAKTMAKKAPAARKQPAQAEAKQILDMVLKEFQAYEDSKGEQVGRPQNEASNSYLEAFLKAFQISSEITRAKGKDQAKIGRDDEPSVANYGSAFMQAYDQAKTLKKALEAQKASDSKGATVGTVEALNAFLKAGKALEEAIKLRAKVQAIEDAKKEIKNAESRMEKRAPDQPTELEALEEIERAIREVKKHVQERSRR